uniref:Bifunctional uridylyltransferase/uridylyl-removing enzyme n=1 Tax=uncultured Thiotrichaceae bacterium TaxID=298394 RepID=A0A6S6TFA8_9GAMM|nr:MAG: [Protein-PII] uridylyltransferase (EC [uncultured Thiotrichaceae bacterium]
MIGDGGQNALLATYRELRETTEQNPSVYTKLLSRARERLMQAFELGENIHSLLHQYSDLIDYLLHDQWLRHPALTEHALIAVGGYGRREMHPASDIDLLILLQDDPNQDCQDQLSEFLTFLWDIGLDVGHSVRTMDECLDAAKEDLTVITNLLESRHLAGQDSLFEAMRAGIRPDKMWDSHTFFIAKLEEQQNRYEKFGETAHRVEPNIKEGRGGLRDIQMVSWIIEREYGHISLFELYEHQLLKQGEYDTLRKGREFLWRIRFILHNIAGRKEDRLLFDYQHTLAQHFGYKDLNRNDAVEAFMQRYYTTITELERLTDVLLGAFHQNLHKDRYPVAEMVGEWYEKKGTMLSVNSNDTFVIYPTALLEIFLILQKTPGVTSLSPDTIRLMRQHLHRIDSGFRQQAWHRQIFMQIMRQPFGVTFVMRLMNRYGVLAAYIPAFANIVGRMQYDLFHAYTVDEHTLVVLSNVRRYSTEKGAEDFSFGSEIFKTLQKPSLLYLSALFHDIAKGRDGDHSTLGAEDALVFGREHGLNLHDAELVSWLVRNHLVMSITAQRKDISDPTVIQQFAAQVVEQERLDYLFLLTIADMKGTNPKLWNNWKLSLLSELYRHTREFLLNRTPVTEETEHLVSQKRKSALEHLNELGFPKEACKELWTKLGDDYLLKHSVETISWHATHILTTSPEMLPLADIRVTSSNSSNVIFVYSKDFPGLFTRVVSTLEQLNLNIAQSRLVSIDTEYDLHTLHILGPDNQIITDTEDQKHIVNVMQRNLSAEDFTTTSHRQPRILRNFDIPTRTSFRQLPDFNLTLMEVNTGDMPGLLSRIGETLDQLDIKVHHAQISTLGEQAEDTFAITTRGAEMITDEAYQQKIREALTEAVKV